MNEVYVSLGSNLGDRKKCISQAVNRLGAYDGVELKSVSSFYETEPEGLKDQPRFLNAAAYFETLLGPEEFLDLIHDVEKAGGRVRTQRWGPRTIDIDIVLFADKVIRLEDLTVPHPRMHKRSFVLDPLSEIAADVIHPIFKKSVRDLKLDLEGENLQQGELR